MSWNHPDDVPTSLTRRAYALRGVTLSQNQYAAVVADAYEDIARHVAHELAEKQRAQQAPAAVLAVMGYAAIWRQAVDACADLIDPQKEGQ